MGKDAFVDIGLLIEILTRLALGLGIGFAIGMTGIGSGVIAMPYLLYGVGLSPVCAVGTGLLYSTLTKAYGVYVHFRLRTIRKRTAFYIILGGVPVFNLPFSKPCLTRHSVIPLAGFSPALPDPIFFKPI